MSKDYSVNLEEELQEALQDAVDGYLEGRDAINEGEFGDFIKGKLGEFALKYAADNSEDILNAIFGEDNVKKSTEISMCMVYLTVLLHFNCLNGVFME